MQAGPRPHGIRQDSAIDSSTHFRRWITIRHELLIGPLLGLLEDASRLPLGTRRDEELYGTDRVGAFAAFTSNIDRDALGFESALDDLCLDP